MLSPLSRFNLARTHRNNLRCTRPPFIDQCQVLGSVRIRVKETKESLVRLEIARSAQIHALGPRDVENRIASDGRNFHVFAVLHVIDLSTIVISTAMAWPLRKAFIPETTTFAIEKNYASDSFRFAQILGSTVKGQSEPRSKHPDQNKHCNKFGSKIMIRGVRFNAYFTPSWATLARQCTTEAGSQQFGDNISAACVLRTVEAPWQTLKKN